MHAISIFCADFDLLMLQVYLCSSNLDQVRNEKTDDLVISTDLDSWTNYIKLGADGKNQSYVQSLSIYFVES